MSSALKIGLRHIRQEKIRSSSVESHPLASERAACPPTVLPLPSSEAEAPPHGGSDEAPASPSSPPALLTGLSPAAFSPAAAGGGGPSILADGAPGPSTSFMSIQSSLTSTAGSAGGSTMSHSSQSSLSSFSSSKSDVDCSADCMAASSSADATAASSSSASLATRASSLLCPRCSRGAASAGSASPERNRRPKTICPSVLPEPRIADAVARSSSLQRRRSSRHMLRRVGTSALPRAQMSRA
mmetsp:Transcript_66834/g.175224  ORF Transcript_66834/g.175224 Transcript_66834/m.175224 type:complete len:242 (-) Transcript_66834:82-807(-)